MSATREQLKARIVASLVERFGVTVPVREDLPGLDELARIAGHCSHRKFSADEVDPALLKITWIIS